MYFKVNSGALMGIHGVLIQVEVDVSDGFPCFSLVGLPDSAVRESMERVRTAIKNTGMEFPYKRITVNLAPADLRKEGPVYDLPIAMGILGCLEQFNRKNMEAVFVIGELSLDGGIRRVNGILSMVDAACRHGIKTCIVPKENAAEAAVVEGASVIGVSSLYEVIGYLNGEMEIEAEQIDITGFFESKQDSEQKLDFCDIRGQRHLRRALEIAAAGRHNVLMLGSPGTGKTMAAKRVPTILPDLSFEESLELTKIYSVAGLMKQEHPLIMKRPFRSPHHIISQAALTGGGTVPHPGEISLAHYGVLFLDELPEFQKNVLEVLRQPMEDKEVTISRAHSTLTFPADFMLIGSMNPCPCGFYPDPERCSCTPPQIARYLSRISGPLLDRMDLHVEAARIDYATLADEGDRESSEDIRSRVMAAHERQKHRLKGSHVFFNAGLTSAQMQRFCKVERTGQALLAEAFGKLGLSARAYNRILKVGRTIADLAGEEMIRDRHIAEAIQYRTLDRKYWGR